MSKDFFWIVSVFLISLNIVLFKNTQNYLILGIVLILSTLYIGFKFNKLFLEDKDQNKEPPPDYDKVEIILLMLPLLFFFLSRFFSQYETELLIVAVFFGLARMVRVSIIKKKKNS
jgi:uncharacterized protein involved in response to NO